jgi:SAM-dependent methyltransferase
MSDVVHVEVMRVMAEMVRPSGKVTGIDVDGKRAAILLQFWQARDTSNARLSKVTFTADPLGKDCSFDIVFSRLVLMHLDDRMRGLQQMFSWVKPGGCLIVQDYHFNSIDAYPPYGPVAELKRCS